MSSERLLLYDFHDGAYSGAGSKVGGVVRVVEPGAIRTLTTFLDGPNAAVRFEQHTEFAGRVEEWSRFSKSEGPGKPPLEAIRRSGTVVVGGVERPELYDTVPSYAAHLVLERMLADGSARTEFTELVEALPPRAVPASFVRRGRETVRSANGMIEADRYELINGGRLSNTLWCEGGSVVVVDWNGARSHLVPTLAELLDGLDPQVAGWIEEFVARSYES